MCVGASVHFVLDLGKPYDVKSVSNWPYVLDLGKSDDVKSVSNLATCPSLSSGRQFSG